MVRPDREEPYIFHFPDGNAGVARSIVRKLIPAAVPGTTMEDLVLSRVDYDLLDLPANKTRIRLESTAVDVRHADGDKFVDVSYVSGGKVAASTRQARNPGLLQQHHSTSLSGDVGSAG